MWRLRGFLLASMSSSLALTGAAMAVTLSWPGPNHTPCALLNLQGCIDIASPGDIVQVRTNTPVNEDLTIDKSLTLRAAPGFTPALAPLHYVYLSNPATAANTMTFQDFTLQQGRIIGAQISIFGCTMNLRNLTVQNTYNDGPELEVNAGYNAGYVGPVTLDVANNHFTVPAGSQYQGAQVISVDAGSSSWMHASIHNNRIDHFQGGQSGAIRVYNGSFGYLQAEVIANEIRGSNFNDGIILFQPGSGHSFARFLDNLVVGQTNVAGAPGAYVVDVSAGHVDFMIDNNTTANGDTGILVTGRDDLGASWNGTVTNNIVSTMTGGGIEIDQPTQTSGNVANDHNFVYNVGFNSFTPGTGTLSVDPLFVGGTDYHLTLASPARDAGGPAGVPADLGTDLDGNPRLFGTVDMGAYELQSAVCAAPQAAWSGCGVPIATQQNGQMVPGIAPDGAGGAYVSYLYYADTAEGIYLNRIDANGNQAPGWPVNGVPVLAPTSLAANAAHVAADGVGGAILAWSDTRNDNDDDAYVQRLTATGSIAPGWPAGGLPLHPTTPAYDEVIVDLAADGQGGAFAAWGGGVGQVTHVLSSGAIDSNWPAGGLSLGTSNLRMIADGSGGVFIFWATATELRVVRYTAAATLPPGWTSSGVLVGAGYQGQDLVLDLQSDGTGASVGWRNPTTQQVMMSMVTWTGTLASGWPANGVSLTTSTTPKSRLSLVNGGASGGATLIWLETPPTPASSQYYAKRLTSTGSTTPGWPATGWAFVPPSVKELDAVPDCSSGVTVRFRLSSGEWAIRTTESGTVSPGWPAAGVQLCSGPSASVVSSLQPLRGMPDGSGGIMTAVSRSPVASFTSFDVFGLHIAGNGVVTEGFSAATPAGSNVQASLGPVQVTFASVSTQGQSWLTLDSSGPPPPFGLQIVPSSPATYYDVSTTAQYAGSVQVCITYDPAQVTGPEGGLQMLHYDTGSNPPAWSPVTVSVDTVANVVCGSSPSLSPFVLVAANPTDVGPSLPRAYQLLANAPNPFNPVTTIYFDVPVESRVRLDVLDVSGRLVRTLVDGRVDIGRHQVVWRGDDNRGNRVASGVYLYRMRSGLFVATRRMVLLK